MLFNDNTLAGDWRERVFHCRDQGLSIDRETAFAVAVADLLQLPDDMPLMPAVAAAMSIPTRLSDRGKPRAPESPGTCRRSWSLGRRRQSVLWSPKRRGLSGLLSV